MKSIKILISAAAFFMGALAGSAALAHSDEFLDTQNAPNGGQVRMAGAYHFELVVAKDSKGVTNNPVLVYVTDHAGARIQTAGASGTATILSGKSKATVILTPEGDSRMKGLGKYASTPDMKAVISITLAGKPAEQARFTPLAPLMPAKDGHADHQH